MKVLLAAHIGFPWGGVSQRYSDLISSSLPEKIDLIFFETSPNKKSGASTGIINLQNIIGFFVVFVKFIKLLLIEKPQIVHIASAFGLSFLKFSFLILVAKIFKTKVILAPHCSYSVFIPVSKIFRYWMKFTLNQSDGIIILSEEWQKITSFVSRPKIMFLKNSINLSEYLKIKRIPTGKKEIIKILFLGYIGVKKGIFDLIEAVNLLDENTKKNILIEIFGDDLVVGETKKAKEKVKQLGLSNYILFFEPIFGREKIEKFKNADIYILASHHEGLPISIIEAMAASLPVIATNIGGIPDIVKNQSNGILINPKNPKEIANAMRLLINDQTLRFLYGENGRKLASKEHDIENYVDKLISYYKLITND